MSTVGDPASDFIREVVSTSEDLPDYALELAAYHRAHGSELRNIVGNLPLNRGDRVLDLACGDGDYSHWLAERVGDAGLVIGLDSSVNYLELAQITKRARPSPLRCGRHARGATVGI